MINTTIYTAPAECVSEISAVVTTPSDFVPGKEKLPVVLFLHGAGERGKNDEEMLKRVSTHGIPMYFGADCEYHGHRVITVSPQCPEEFFWTYLILPLKKWFDTFVEKFGGDTEKLSITGISMGGFGTWDFITTFPGYFRRSAPICGGGFALRANTLCGADIRVYHGLDDDCVPFEKSLEMVRAATHFGANVEFTAYDKVGHGSWVKAYADTDLIDWLCYGDK